MMVISLSYSLHLRKHVQYFPMLVLSEVDLLHHVKEHTCLLSLYEKKNLQAGSASLSFLDYLGKSLMYFVSPVGSHWYVSELTSTHIQNTWAELLLLGEGGSGKGQDCELPWFETWLLWLWASDCTSVSSYLPGLGGQNGMLHAKRSAVTPAHSSFL